MTRMMAIGAIILDPAPKRELVGRFFFVAWPLDFFLREGGNGREAGAIYCAFSFIRCYSNTNPEEVHTYTVIYVRRI